VVVRRKKGMRVNYPIIFLSGLVLLVACLLVYLIILKGVYGNYEIDEILPTKKNINYILSAGDKQIAILYSEYTQNLLGDESTWLSDNIDTWETFLKSHKKNYTIIGDQTIERGEFFDYGILVLPGSKSLSDKQLIQIKKYLESGGSVFATSGTATYSDEAKWRGWDFFTEVYGMKFTKELDRTEFKRIHTLRGNLPLTGGIPTGYTLDIATWDRPIYAEILEPRTVQVSYWYDYRREMGLVREEISKSAGIAYGSYGKGRFVWFGFELNSVIGKQEDYIFFDRLFINSIHWLTYQPTGYVKDWPAPYEAAAIFTPTLSEEIYNVNNLVGILKRNKYPATFFVDPYVAAQHPSLIKSLSKYGDFGAIVDVGFLEFIGDTLSNLYQQDVQYSSIVVGSDTLSKITNTRVKGIMPLFGFYDENTLQALSSAGMDFVITDSLTDRSVPEKLIRGDHNLLGITITSRDDKKIIGEYGLTDLNFQRYTYEEDIDRLLFEGGLYVLKVHTDYQLKAEYASVINDVMKYLREKNVWVTSIQELKEWWFKRGGIEIRYETRSKRRIVVEVSNPKERNTDDFVVQVNMNKPVKNIEISSDIINTIIPEFQFDPNSNVLYLFIEDLKPGDSRLLLIDFENVGE